MSEIQHVNVIKLRRTSTRIIELISLSSSLYVIARTRAVIAVDIPLSKTETSNTIPVICNKLKVINTIHGAISNLIADTTTESLIYFLTSRKLIVKPSDNMISGTVDSER